MGEVKNKLCLQTKKDKTILNNVSATEEGILYHNSTLSGAGKQHFISVSSRG